MSMKKILRKERETFSIMTNMKEILGDFNALADARKKSSLLVKLAFGFCALTVSAVLFFSYSLLSSMGNKILVVNENGEYLKQKAMDTDKLYEELLMDSERDKMTRTAHKKIFVANVDKIDDAQYDHMMQVLQTVEDKNDERAVEAIAEIVPTYHPDEKNRPDNKAELLKKNENQAAG